PRPQADEHGAHGPIHRHPPIRRPRSGPTAAEVLAGVQEILPGCVNDDTIIASGKERIGRMSSIHQPALVEHIISKRARDVGEGFPTQTSALTPGMITLSGGTPDFPTPAHVIEAAKRALDENQTAYTPWAGLPELRAAIATKLKHDNGISADPDAEILVTA